MTARVGHIVLAALDMDAATFSKEVASVFPAGDVLTLYASAKDKALKFSKKFNGYPRAGEAGEHLVTTDGVVTIDASAVKTDFLAHSYFGSCRSVIADLFYLLRDVPPDKRHLDKGTPPPSRRYWVIPP